MMTLKIGFVLNPVAGAGGPAALKGSDAVTTREAVHAGILSSNVKQRAIHFFENLSAFKDDLEIVCAEGEMGSNVLDAAKLSYKAINCKLKEATDAEDTKRVCLALLKEKVDLLVFAGGDGTARDVFDAVGEACPCVGIPAGVKMQSGVFGIHPQASAEVVIALLKGESVQLARREVRDIDEAALSQGSVISQFYGELKVPYIENLVQNVKQGGVEVDELIILDIVDELRERLSAIVNDILIFGPGSTTQHIQQEMGLSASLLGVDFFGDNSYLDINEGTLFDLLMAHPDKNKKLILTVIGGQGHLFGRGNQQLSPRVLKLIGRENILVVASGHKLNALKNKALIIDSGDSELDKDWSGLLEVICGYQDLRILKLQN